MVEWPGMHCRRRADSRHPAPGAHLDEGGIPEPDGRFGPRAPRRNRRPPCLGPPGRRGIGHGSSGPALSACRSPARRRPPLRIGPAAASLAFPRLLRIGRGISCSNVRLRHWRCGDLPRPPAGWIRRRCRPIHLRAAGRRRMFRSPMPGGGSRSFRWILAWPGEPPARGYAH